MNKLEYYDTDSVSESKYYKLPNYKFDSIYEFRLMERSKIIELVNAKYGIAKAEVIYNAQT